MQKVVFKLNLRDDKEKSKAMKIASGFQGLLSRVDSISVDMKDMKLTVTGDIDPVKLAGKLRNKVGGAEIVSVGPAKEEKKDDKKKDDGKKDESKDKKGDDKGKKPAEQQQQKFVVPQPPFYPPQFFYPQFPYQQHPMQQYYYDGGRNFSQEEDPHACVIC